MRPYAEYHENEFLEETAPKKSLKINCVEFETLEEEQNAPTPATIFILYYKGDFVTTDLSVCMDSKFDKIMNKVLKQSI